MGRNGILRVEQFAPCRVCLVLNLVRRACALKRNLSQFHLLLLVLFVTVAGAVIRLDFSSTDRRGGVDLRHGLHGVFAEPRIADLLGVLALVDDVFVAHGRMELVWTLVIKCVVLLLHDAVLVGDPRTCATLCHLTLEQRLKVYNWGAGLLVQGACIQSVRGHLVHGVLRRAAQGPIKAVDPKAR